MARKKAKKLQPKKRGRHREKRRNAAKIDPRFLNDGAPNRTYHVDEVATELFLSGFFVGLGENDLLKLIRNHINFTAQYALMAAGNQHVRQPKRRRLIKRLFEDLRVIQARIERNKDLDPIDVALATTIRISYSPPRQKQPVDEIDGLLAALKEAGERIDDFFDRRDPARGGGNRDNLTGTFIDEIFEFWCQHCKGEIFRNESALFLRFLVAAWRDSGFPEGDAAGQRLEERLTDRVRKSIKAGVSQTRVERQEFEALKPLK